MARLSDGAVRAVALALALSLLGAFPGRADGTADRAAENRAAALRLADFILSLQDRGGAITDSAEADTVNADSNMEYALMALAAAYAETGLARYRQGLEKGLDWLARAQVLEDGPWRGSWWYQYDRDGRPVPAPGAGGVTDVRGVDATAALFPYLLYLDRSVTGDGTRCERFRANAEAALTFVLTRNRTASGFMASSFQADRSGVWRRYDCCYSADQGDVWLGLRAGVLLYGAQDCAEAAEFLRRETPGAFYSAAHGRYCVCVADGAQDWSAAGFAPLQSQGYLPWLWGDAPENRACVAWLRRRMTGNRENAYYLSAAFLLLGARGVGETAPDGLDAWLAAGLDPWTGGIRDAPRLAEEYVNVAAFCAMALLDWDCGVR